MSVDISFGESARSIREKAMQDRENVRTRMAKVEQEMLDLRQQDRDLTNFLKTLDRYDPQAPTAIEADSRPPIRTHRIGRIVHPVAYGSFRSRPIIPPIPGSEGAEMEASALAMQAVENLQRGREQMDIAMEAIRAGESVADAMRQGAAIAGMHYLPDRTVPDKRLPRPGTNMRKVTDAAHLYLDLMDHFATTDQLVNHLRSQEDVFQLLGTRPAPTLSSYLSRDPRFEFTRPKGWTLSTEIVDDTIDQGGGEDNEPPLEGGVP